MEKSQIQEIKNQFKSVITELEKLDEIFERNLQPENSKFPLRSLIQITDTGEVYSTYDSWKGLDGYRDHFVNGGRPKKGKDYIFLREEPHEKDFEGNLALIQDPDTTQVFIINVQGIERRDKNE